MLSNDCRRINLFYNYVGSFRYVFISKSNHPLYQFHLSAVPQVVSNDALWLLIEQEFTNVFVIGCGVNQ